MFEIDKLKKKKTIILQKDRKNDHLLSQGKIIKISLVF